MAVTKKTTTAEKATAAKTTRSAPEEKEVVVQEPVSADKKEDIVVIVDEQHPHADEDAVLNHFNVLYGINVNEWIEKKKTGRVELSYLSWANAWAQVKIRYPNATYRVLKFGERQLPYVFDENTGYMCFTEMTIEGITHEMWLPVMDGANKAMKDKPYTYVTGFGQYSKEKTCAAADMFDVNKTIMRCLVKNIGMFGLGLYIYAGEDLPTDPEDAIPQVPQPVDTPAKASSKADDKATEAKSRIQEELVRITAEMSHEDKFAFAKANVEPVVGIINYTMCDDVPKLNKLLAQLKKL